MATAASARKIAGSPATTVRMILRDRVVLTALRAFLAHGGMTTSAALAFYFLMSLLPFLIFLMSALALMPIPHLAVRMVQLAAHFVPKETMPLVQSMLAATLQASHRLVSVGFVVSVVAASNAFAETTRVLNGIYGVEHHRKFWRRRLSALGLTFLVGGMTVVALVVMLLGPHFGRELARIFDLNRTFVTVWPVLRYALAITLAMGSIEVLYYLGPNREHGWRQQLPGTVFAVAVWLVSVGVLGVYLRSFSYMNTMYGTLASFIVLMISLQITAAALLLGAELNVALEQAAGQESGAEAEEA